MSGTEQRRRRAVRRLLRQMRLPLAALMAMSALAAAGMLLLRSVLLQNAYETGTALSRSYAAEESSDLAVYETLLTFGTAALDSRLEAGEDREAVTDFLEMYFRRVDTVLGHRSP